MKNNMKKIKQLAIKINQEKQNLNVLKPPVQKSSDKQKIISSKKSYTKWIIIIVIFFVICGTSIGLYVYFHNKDLCSEYNNALTKYNNSLQIYNDLNVGNNANLTQQQLNYKIAYLKACQSLYNSVYNYKGTDITPVNILITLQNDPNSLITQNYNNNQAIFGWQNKLGQWQLYNSKSCKDLDNINITICILLGIAMLSFIIGIIRLNIDGNLTDFLRNDSIQLKVFLTCTFSIFFVIGLPLIIYYLILNKTDPTP